MTANLQNRADTDAEEPTDNQIVELTIVMPCLNEAVTLARCIRKAQACIARLQLNAEIVVADNGSTDGSPAIALAEGARLVVVPEPGPGSR